VTADGFGEDTQMKPQPVLVAMAWCIGLCLLAYGFVDRPVADYSHGLSADTRRTFIALTHIVDPLPLLAGVLTGGMIVASLMGYRPGARGIAALRIALAILVVMALKEQLKVFTGRTWPETWTNNNPSYIKDSIYGFFPLKSWLVEGGSRAYHSFPSGHMALIAVTCVSIALAWRPFARAAALPILAVAVGLIGANYHWVSDIIAGTALGAAVAVAAQRVGPRGLADTTGPAGQKLS
jgi:membrane-associated phospholipid phosphatase